MLDNLFKYKRKVTSRNENFYLKSKSSHSFLHNVFANSKNNDSFTIKGAKYFKENTPTPPKLTNYFENKKCNSELRTHFFIKNVKYECNLAKKKQITLHNMLMNPEKASEYLNNSKVKDCTQNEDYPFRSFHTICEPPSKKIAYTQIKIAKSNGQSYAYSLKGRLSTGAPKVNQDSFYAEDNYIEDGSLYIVCDGHGKYGKEVSNYVIQYISANLKSTLKQYQPEIALKEIIKQTSDGLRHSGIDCKHSGTTCTLALAYRELLYTCNVGDSRIIMAEYTGGVVRAVPLTIDHKPINKLERKRILSSGGDIKRCKGIDGHKYGPLRVWVKGKEECGLSMTRSIGDTFADAAGIISIPDVRVFRSANNLYIILGSDGLWEFMRNEAAIKLVYCYYINKSMKRSAQVLVSKAYSLWEDEKLSGVDDITAVVAEIHLYNKYM